MEDRLLHTGPPYKRINNFFSFLFLSLLYKNEIIERPRKGTPTLIFSCNNNKKRTVREKKRLQTLADNVSHKKNLQTATILFGKQKNFKEHVHNVFCVPVTKRFAATKCCCCFLKTFYRYKDYRKLGCCCHLLSFNVFYVFLLSFQKIFK